MEPKRKYLGWIFMESSPGYRDYFRAQRTDACGNTRVVAFGYGCAAEAVAYFEDDHTSGEGGVRIQGLNLGRILLERTPLGLRVYQYVDPPADKAD